MAANITLSDLFQIGQNAARTYPLADPKEPCQQPQAFRVLQLERGAEIGTPNLGAVPTDKDTPFFWSRAWERAAYNPNALKFDFPLVTMYEVVSESQKSAFSTQGFNQCYTVEISVIDAYREDCTGKGQVGCNARPVNQIYIDTGEILFNVLQYFGQSVLATTSEDDTERIYYLPYLVAQKASGAIAGYAVTTALQDVLLAQNSKMRFSRVEFATQKYYGTKTQFTFCSLNCPVIEYDLTSPDFGLLAFESGCSGCR